MGAVSERLITWVPPVGNAILLSDYINGYHVLEGIIGFDSPTFDNHELITPALDGSSWLGSRAQSRELFIPIEIWGLDRPTFLARKTTLFSSLNPQLGQQTPGMFNVGTIRVQDINGSSRSIAAYYVGGAEGDEGQGAGGRDWARVGLRFRTLDPYWSASTPSSQVWSASSSPKFFPFFPLKVGSSQILSGTGATVHNLVMNPSFEWGLNNWTVYRDPGVAGSLGLLTRQTSLKQIGNYGGRIDWDPGNGEQWVGGDLGVLTAGVSHLLHVYLYCHGTDQIWFSIGTGAHSILAGVDINAAGFQDQWTQWVLHLTPGGTLGYQVFIGKRDGTAGGFLIIDKVQVNVVSEQDYPSDVYIDGDQPNCVWEGTVGGSVSHRIPAFAPTTVLVGGDIQVWPVWYFAGPFTDIQVTNNTTGRSFRFTLNVPVGSVLTIDTRPRRQSATVTSNTGVVTNAWPYLVVDDLFPLPVGNNDISLQVFGTDLNSSANLIFYPSYLAAA